jgi:hypothetical protein
VPIVSRDGSVRWSEKAGSKSPARSWPGDRRPATTGLAAGEIGSATGSTLSNPGAGAAIAPPVQNRAIVGPIGQLDAAGFELVLARIDGTPVRVGRLVVLGCANVLDRPFIDGAKPLEVALGFDQGQFVGAAAPVRPPKLDRVVFPEANRTDQM